MQDNGIRESGELVHFILYLKFQDIHDKKIWNVSGVLTISISFHPFHEQFQGFLIEKISYFN